MTLLSVAHAMRRRCALFNRKTSLAQPLTSEKKNCLFPGRSKSGAAAGLFDVSAPADMRSRGRREFETFRQHRCAVPGRLGVWPDANLESGMIAYLREWEPCGEKGIFFGY